MKGRIFIVAAVVYFIHSTFCFATEEPPAQPESGKPKSSGVTIVPLRPNAAAVSKKPDLKPAGQIKKESQETGGDQISELPGNGGTLTPPGLAGKDKLPKGLEKKDKKPLGWEKGKKLGWSKDKEKEAKAGSKMSLTEKWKSERKEKEEDKFSGKSAGKGKKGKK
ncbi:MAG: hypothetical protein HY587_02150 [Candidatus Omnitrophica bacterium]|nr:hypothetical protein [Candidatus Omnitrophota bacterium]